MKNRHYHVKIIVPPGSTSMVMYSMDEAGRISAVLRSQGWMTSMEIGIPKPFIDLKAILILILRWHGDEQGPLIAQALGCQTAGILVQGRIASTCFEKILVAHPALTAVVLGESEQTTPQALETLENKENLENVPGLAWIRDGQLVKTPLRPCLEDLDLIPWPDRRYLEPGFGFPFPVVPIEASRGCRGTCLFCTTNQYRRGQEGVTQIRMRAPEKVADEIAGIISQYHKNVFYFVNDNFFAVSGHGQAWARSLADAIIGRDLNIHYYIECRVDDVEPALFEHLKKSGLKHVYLGLESGSQQALNRYGKGTTVEQNRQAIAVLDALGIENSAGFIFYDPCMTWTEMAENIEFIADVKLLEKSKHTTVLGGMIAYPGTVWERRLRDQGIDPDATAYPFQDPRVAAFVQRIGVGVRQLGNWALKLQRWRQQADDLINATLRQRQVPERYKFRARLPETLDWKPWNVWLKQCWNALPDRMRQIYHELNSATARTAEADPGAETEAWIEKQALATLGKPLAEREREVLNSLAPEHFGLEYQGQILHGLGKTS